jgi:hypothetical protein
MDIKRTEWGGMDWNNMAQDKVHWMTDVDAAMNIPDP